MAGIREGISRWQKIREIIDPGRIKQNSNVTLYTLDAVTIDFKNQKRVGLPWLGPNL
jgi:hypothetical protein